MHVIKYSSRICVSRTYERSVREGAAKTTPQLPQNCAYGPFTALHLEHDRADVDDINGYNHITTICLTIKNT